jgi:hypothetical protein
MSACRTASSDGRARGSGGAGGGSIAGGGGATPGGAAGAGPALVYDRGPYGQAPEPRALFVDGSDLVWAEIGAEGSVVKRGPKTGAGPVSSIGTWLDSDRTLRLFAADAAAVYWLRGPQIAGARKSGEALPPLELGAGRLGGGIVSDGDVLRVVTPGCASIGSVPKSGGQAVFVENPGIDYHGGGTDLAVDGDYVYCGYGAYVFALGKAGSPPAVETWVSDQEAAAPLASDGTTVFWVNNRRVLGTGPENLASVGKRPPRTPAVLATIGEGMGILLHDSTRRVLYGGGSGSDRGRIVAYDIAAARLTVLLDATRNRGGLAQDEQFLYWVSDTRIWRLAKD